MTLVFSCFLFSPVTLFSKTGSTHLTKLSIPVFKFFSLLLFLIVLKVKPVPHFLLITGGAHLLLWFFFWSLHLVRQGWQRQTPVHHHYNSAIIFWCVGWQNVLFVHYVIFFSQHYSAFCFVPNSCSVLFTNMLPAEWKRLDESNSKGESDEELNMILLRCEVENWALHRVSGVVNRLTNTRIQSSAAAVAK